MNEDTDGADALDALYWRSEILQALFWMRGEGLAEAVTCEVLARFLTAETATVSREMDRLAAEGYLEIVMPGDSEQGGLASPGGGPTAGYRLTALGVAEGGRSFQDEFFDLTRPTHGECAPGCWCLDPAHAGKPCPSYPEPSHAV